MITFNAQCLKNVAFLGLSLALLPGNSAPAQADGLSGNLTLSELRHAAGTAHVGQIWLQTGLPASQIQSLLRDREVLASLKIGAQDSAMISQTLGAPSASAEALTSWLEDRVQAVVTEDFDPGTHLVTISRTRPTFENPDLMPTLEDSKIKTSGKAVIIMSNVGAGLYYGAKTNKVALGLQIPGVGTINLTSPRAGIIKIGPGLFTGNRVVTPKRPNALANSIPRLATFFHEARHSDGNGKSLSFFHAICPEGHTLAGYNACDRNLNGPYTVGGWTLKGMTEGCAKCTIEQREKLRLQYLDSFGRALPKELDGQATVSLDATPEGKR